MSCRSNNGQIFDKNGNRSSFAEKLAKLPVIPAMEDVVDIYKQAVRFVDKGVSKIYFAFAGARGAARMHANNYSRVQLMSYVTARQMKDAGASNVDIFRATSWQQDSMGNWFFEIPDNYKLKTDVTVKMEQAPGLIEDKQRTLPAVSLGELYDNEELFQAYPQLRGVKIYFHEFEDKRVAGTANTEDQYLVISRDMVSIQTTEDGDIKLVIVDEADVLSFVAHEVQHLIQTIEDFPEGGNPGLINEVILSVLSNLRSGTPQDIENIKNFLGYLGVDHHDIVRLLLALRANNTQAVKDILEQLSLVVYGNIIGEVQARNVQARMKLSPIVRNATMAVETEDVPRDVQVSMEELTNQLIQMGIITPDGTFRRGTQQQRVDSANPQKTNNKIFVGNLAKILSEKFQVDVEFIDDPSQRWKGAVRNGKVYLNLAYVTEDTPLHEFGHILINHIKNENKRLYANLMRQIKSSNAPTFAKDIISDVKRRYPEYNDAEVYEESMVELLGLYALDQVKKTNSFYEILKEAWEFVLDFLNINRKDNQRAVLIEDLNPSSKLSDVARLLSNPYLDIKSRAAGNDAKVEAKRREVAENLTRQKNEEMDRLYNRNTPLIGFKPLPNTKIVKREDKVAYKKAQDALEDDVKKLNEFINCLWA